VSETIEIETPGRDADLFPDEHLAPTRTLLETQSLVAALIDRRAADPAGLDPATADLLVRLAKSADCGIRGVDIGEQCQMTATRVSRLVDRAEDGRAAARRLAPRLEGVLHGLMFETFSAEERHVLVELLGRLRDRAREMLAERNE
jgi:DNA-binding MarR family transcriptional regulator